MQRQMIDLCSVTPVLGVWQLPLLVASPTHALSQYTMKLGKFAGVQNEQMLCSVASLCTFTCAAIQQCLCARTAGMRHTFLRARAQIAVWSAPSKSQPLPLPLQMQGQRAPAQQVGLTAATNNRNPIKLSVLKLHQFALDVCLRWRWRRAHQPRGRGEARLLGGTQRHGSADGGCRLSLATSLTLSSQLCSTISTSSSAKRAAACRPTCNLLPQRSALTTLLSTTLQTQHNW
jgi:hypothetical protein